MGFTKRKKTSRASVRGEPTPADRVLEVVAAWADGYVCFRETGAVLGGQRRLDGLLVPVNRQAHCMREVGEDFFARPRLVGVEVKVQRADFLKGLGSGQFEAYAEAVSALYVATAPGVCATREIPEDCGHLIVDVPRAVVRCERHPTYRDVPMPADVPWRLLFRYVALVNDALGKLPRLSGVGEVPHA